MQGSMYKLVDGTFIDFSIPKKVKMDIVVILTSLKKSHTTNISRESVLSKIVKSSIL